MQQELAVLQQVSVRLGGVTILDNISLVLRKGEQWAVIGASGSGKTTLVHAMAGKVFFRGTIDYSFPVSGGGGQQVVVVEQQHKFRNRSNTSDFYYQQRFNAADADNSLTVAEELADYTSDIVARDYWLNLLHMIPLVNKPLLQLSNGENKRLQLVKALLEDPALLVLDHPFTGLDVEGRKTLHGIIDTLAAGGRHLLLVTSPTELPGCITHVAILEKGRLAWAGKKEDAQQHLPARYPLFTRPTRPCCGNCRRPRLVILTMR